MFICFIVTDLDIGAMFWASFFFEVSLLSLQLYQRTLFSVENSLFDKDSRDFLKYSSYYHYPSI